MAASTQSLKKFADVVFGNLAAATNIFSPTLGDALSWLFGVVSLLVIIFATISAARELLDQIRSRGERHGEEEGS